MTYDNEAIVRRAYHTAEGDALDVAGFVVSFTEDGVFNDVVGQESYRGEQLGDVLLRGPLETPAGIVQPTGAKIDVPTADFWYLRDGKIETFNCYVGYSIMFPQMGVLPDFASAVAEPAAAR